jgi:isopenicillin-N epimerase
MQRINHLTGLMPLYQSEAAYYQMAVAQLPREIDAVTIKQRLLDEFKVEVPIIEWEQMKLMRVSIQGYNSSRDIDRLLNTLSVLLP